MHRLSDAAAAPPLYHLHSPDLAASLPFPSLPNFTPSHYHSSLLPYSHLLGSELEPVQESPGFFTSEVSHSGSSGPCSSYGSPTSLPSCGTHTVARPAGLIQRSVSSHSLPKNGFTRRLGGVQVSSLFDVDGPVRRVYSAGDLQGTAESPLSSESSLIIEGMAKACRYSPEEKRERIERYKTKRFQRNFNKKIKYECRKTLADSRRRIRGRFARNEEAEHKNCSSPLAEEEEEEEEESWTYASATPEDDGSWITFLDSYSVDY